MKLFPIRIFFPRALLVLALLRATASSALSPDPRLLPLVLPGSQLVAGMRAPFGQGQPDSFLLITHNNAVDLEDFFAITGSDPSRIIHQVIFTASADNSGNLTEHSILASGQFDHSKLFRSANSNSIQYRGISVLPFSALGRAKNASNDLRWFTLTGSDIAVFGTVATVKQELDRFLASTKSDVSLIRTLGRLRSDDDTWCLLSLPAPSAGIRDVLGMLNPRLAESLEEGGSFLFGIRTRGKVEFEYEIDGSSSSSAETVSNSLAKSLTGSNAKTSSLLPRRGSDESHIYGVVKVSRPRYEAWLIEVSAQSHSKSAAAPK
jgi:hypothetical protein